ncbi:hypothetical protein BT96DRAFT_993460 [Gymnopus androsaceus JB14]|uniref:DUF4419 domain-containing protein n=1 Tax=Gymnopus androsaceus JB14 TaxID=1447944 RepID=A0A6A4HSK2_9AGAR|nr:hypothetical protein BT96DRAFT_993460 [Gymnopus androsaceus JB14]
MPITFYPSSKKLTPYVYVDLKNPNSRSEISATYTLLMQCMRNGSLEVLQSSIGSKPDNDDGMRFEHANNGLVHTLVKAYSNHHAVSIRPDDVWIAILTQFSIFVNANAEALREKFVAHEGQIELQVTEPFGNTRHTADFGEMAKRMTGKIRENVKDGAICDWILPQFSTTTNNDLIVSSVIMMSTMSQFFRFKFLTACGIPQVTLEGTTEDWKLILARIEELKGYGKYTTAWYNLLKPVISRLISAFEAPDHPDNLKFWGNVASEDHEGSGSPTLKGWANAFCVFGEKGNWLGREPGEELRETYSDLKPRLVLDSVSYHSVALCDIPASIISVDVKLDDNGELFDTTMVAGLVGYQVTDTEEVKTALLKPFSGWWMFIKRSQEEIGSLTVTALEQEKRSQDKATVTALEQEKRSQEDIDKATAPALEQEKRESQTAKVRRSRLKKWWWWFAQCSRAKSSSDL